MRLWAISSLARRVRSKNKDVISIFDSTGLAIQDAAVAQLVYKQAVKSDIGRQVQFF